MSSLLSSHRYVGSGASTHELLTVLLTVRDRPSFTQRWLDYADQQRFPFLVCIADGGTDEQVQRAIASGRYRHLAIQFLKFTPDQSYQDYYSKLRTACDEITTKAYSLQADNDDFYSSAGILACVDFLEAHQDFSGCQGETVGFRLSGESQFLYARSALFSKAYRPFYDFAADSGVDRFAAVANANVQTWYAVTRRESLRRTFAFVEHCNFSDLFLIELVREFALLAHGKVKCLHIPYYFRQVTTASSSNDTFTAKAGLLHERILFSSFCSDLLKIQQWLVAELSPATVDREAVATRVQEALNQFVVLVIESGCRTKGATVPFRRRATEALRARITRTAPAARLMNRLDSGGRGDAETRRQYDQEFARIRSFLRAADSAAV